MFLKFLQQEYWYALSEGNIRLLKSKLPELSSWTSLPAPSFSGFSWVGFSQISFCNSYGSQI